MRLQQDTFQPVFDKFLTLVRKYDGGHAFTNFREGLVGGFENYKPRLRGYARTKLSPEAWQKSSIGSGDIVNHAIASIEIQDSKKNLTNNLVFWQNRYGHATREHRALLEARGDRKALLEIEKLLFDLYRTDENEAEIFDRIANFSHHKYPLLAYLFFLKDIDRFCPIQPTGYDHAFRELGINLVTLRNCTSQNYVRYNEALGDVRLALEIYAGQKNVRLIDAHSFCWVYVTLLRREMNAEIEGNIRTSGRVVEARERCIVNMKYSIIQTAQQSRGQVVDRSIQLKAKNLGFDEYDLEGYLKELMLLQGDRCALTGIPFQFDGNDRHLLPSPDRIDSDGHYERGNIQIVCQFINFWKGNTKNEEFSRLLVLVREGAESAQEIL